MTPKQIDELLARAAERPLPPDHTGVARAKNTILSSLRPVRPLASTGALAIRFFIVFVSVAVAGAAIIGIYGVRALTPIERSVIFPVVIASAAFAAIAAAREMRPAGGTRIGGITLTAVSLGLLAIFAVFFHDYGMERFVRQGIGCLKAGLAFSVAAAIIVCVLLARGYIQNLAAAGLAAGTVAGLAGLGALELHCPILKTMHVMVWHLAVVVISGAAGWTVGWFLEILRRRRAA